MNLAEGREKTAEEDAEGKRLACELKMLRESNDASWRRKTRKRG